MFLIEFDRESFVDAEKIDCIYAGGDRLCFTIKGSGAIYNVEDAQNLSFLSCVNELNSNKLIKVGGNGSVWGDE